MVTAIEILLYYRFITLPFLAHDPKAIEIVQVILESILLRREKNMRDSDGKRIVDLPPKEVSLQLQTLLKLFIDHSIYFRFRWRIYHFRQWKGKFTIRYMLKQRETMSS